MVSKFVAYLKANAKGHVIGIVIAAGIILGFTSYMAEHDARIKADAEVKTVQTEIAGLQKQKTAIDKTARVQIVRLQTERAEVQTAPQAFESIPEVSTLKVTALPNSPDVSVGAVPLYQELNACKQATIGGDACAAKAAIDKEILADKDEQIKALKKKPSFWHRVKSAAVTLGIGAAAGYVIAHSGH